MVNRIRKALAQRDQGFTLIELLVVIIIIGILAAIAIPVFLNQRQKGIDAGIKSDLKNAALAVETWMTDNPATAVPVETWTSTGATTPATGAVLGLKVSSGTTIKVKQGATTGLYTICGWNAGASVAKTGAANANLVYDSNAGGVQSTPGAAAC